VEIHGMFFYERQIYRELPIADCRLRISFHTKLTKAERPMPFVELKREMRKRIFKRIFFIAFSFGKNELQII